MPTAIEIEPEVPLGFRAVSESLALMQEMLRDIRIGASSLKEARLTVTSS